MSKLDPLRIVEASFKAGATGLDHLPPPVGVEIAFAGRSNVGKSSLMNALCGRRNLVKTSSTPGCTRQISFFEVTTADKAVVTLVDLPGYGYAKRSKSERAEWARLIEGYLLGRSTLRAVVSLVDVRRGVEPDDFQLLELLKSAPLIARPELNVITAATKLDKLRLNQRQPALNKVKSAASTEVVGVSAELEDTQRLLWRKLRSLASIGAENVPDATGEQSNDTGATSQADAASTRDPQGQNATKRADRA